MKKITGCRYWEQWIDIKKLLKKVVKSKKKTRRNKEGKGRRPSWGFQWPKEEGKGRWMQRQTCCWGRSRKVEKVVAEKCESFSSSNSSSSNSSDSSRNSIRCKHFLFFVENWSDILVDSVGHQFQTSFVATEVMRALVIWIIPFLQKKEDPSTPREHGYSTAF